LKTHKLPTKTKPAQSDTLDLPRVVHELPKEPVEIKPHPHGVELGTLQRMLHEAGKQRVQGFLTQSFSRVTPQIAAEMLTAAGISPEADAHKIPRPDSERLYRAIQAPKIELVQPPPPESAPPPAETKLPKKKVKAPQLSLFSRAAPPLEPAAPVEEQREPAAPKVKIESDEEGAQVIALGEDTFVTAVTRPPAIYRGNPFQVECGILYSKQLPGDELAKVFRFANRVPLLYQASACAMTKAVVSAPWRSYEVLQAKGALPTGPLVILVHIASAWVPYTSESKEAIAHYPEVLKEMRLAVMEAGRRLQRFLRRKKRDLDEQKKRDYITRYLDPIGEALRDILALDEKQTQEALENLKIVLEKSRIAASDEERAKRKEADKRKRERQQAKEGKQASM
jgi:DNA topoisomerase-6 subunit B